MKVAEETFRQLEFVLNISLLLTGKIRISVTGRGSFKQIFGSGAYPVLQRLCIA